MIATPSLWRLTRVEARKMLDTRAGMSLAMLSALLAAGAAAATVLADEPRMNDALGASAFVIALLVPVMSMLLVTGEWSQRSGLITFALVPRRERVIGAKLMASSAVAAAGSAVVLAVTTAIGAFGGFDVSLSAGLLGQTALMSLLMVIVGTALGLAFAQSVSAVTVYFVAPLLLGTISEISKGVESVIGWLDPTWIFALAEENLSSGDWKHVGAASALWITAPLTAGLIRLRRGELK